MSGITDLNLLLSSMTPTLVSGRLVFAAVSDSRSVDSLGPVCIFREEEAITVVCAREQAAKAGLETEGIYRQITLQVHSSLQAIGLLAVVASALADAGIPCNTVSAFYHDHIFVPEEKAERAMEILKSLTRTPESA
jgi:hypothetical protein